MTESSSLKFKYIETQYETLAPLGEAASKNVFLCKDKKSGKIVVKKYVAPNVCPVYEKLQNISNIHIPQTYETVYDEKTGLIIEEFVNGMTLREFIGTKGTPDKTLLCQIICDICDALSASHDAGIIHRDINLDNIMISNDGILKVIDFGIARILKENKSQDTSFLGTAGYAPPEQFGFAQTDARSDIYSVGIVISELLSGELLPGELLRKESYQYGEFGDIVRKCTEIDPKQRFQTITELWQAVKEISPSMLGNGKNSMFANVRITEKTSAKLAVRDGIIISWLPGFRTGQKWKNIVATLGYLFLILCTYVMMTAEDYISSAAFFLPEALAIFFYLWMPAFVISNFGNWDRKIYLFRKFPPYITVIFRIALGLILFYAGARLEEYVKYTLMGLLKNS